ncbi:hypothetical protein [Aquiflexum sp.]|uniref:hypothetical protein n=1 Tax=Aquiflexum sp. TaxID=1872584 RepID=UPI0035945E4C
MVKNSEMMSGNQIKIKPELGSDLIVLAGFLAEDKKEISLLPSAKQSLFTHGDSGHFTRQDPMS